MYTNKINKQKSLQIGILVFALLILPITLILLKANQRTSGPAQAAPGNAALSIIPTTSNHDTNETGIFNVRIDPNGENVSSVELVIKYDPSIIQLGNITPGNFFTDPQNQGQVAAPQIIINSNDINTGTLHYALGFPLGSNFSSNQFGYIANINYTTLAEGTSPLTITVSGTPSTLVADINAQNVTDVNNIANGQINVGTSTSGAALNISNSNPSGATQQINQPFTVDVLVSTGGQEVVGVDAHVKFDASVLELTNVQTTGGDISTQFKSYPSPISPWADENQTGTVIISANIGTSDIPTPVNGDNIKIAELTFRPTTTTNQTQLEIAVNAIGDRNDSNVVLYQTDNNTDPIDILSTYNGYTLAIADVPTPTAVPTQPDQPTPTPTIINGPTPTQVPTAKSIALKFLLEGRISPQTNKIANVSIKYKVWNTTDTPTTVNTQTNSSGQANFSIIPNSYVFLLEVPGYLPKKFPTDNTPILIQNTTNNVDLTSSGPLLGGEFNNDGIINEIDYTLNSGFLGKFLTNDPAVDLDGSGQVNNLDFAIMRRNWFKTADTL